jgi:hypothetical protein
MTARVEQLLAQHEGKTLEFKACLAEPLPFLKTLVAFANSAGGTIVSELRIKRAACWGWTTRSNWKPGWQTWSVTASVQAYP